MKLVTKLLLICFIAACFIPPVYAADCNTRCCDEEYPKLMVWGQGKVDTLADKAVFMINARTEEKKLDKAFEVSAQKINSISDILKTLNIKKEDVRNLGYVYHPLYEGKKIFTSIDRPTSYEVIYTLKITVYDMDRLGKILSALSDIQETAVYGLEYTSTKIEELKREALAKAASDAREKAKILAEGTGAALGKVLKIESSVTDYSHRAYQAERMLAKGKAAVDTVEPQIESGSLEIKANCSVYYSIQ